MLRANIVNYTRDFPFVWDELTLAITNEGDVAKAIRLFTETATRVLGEAMAAPAGTYRQLLHTRDLDFDISTTPQVFVTVRDAWTDVTIRYLVAACERRQWPSVLTTALIEAVDAQEGGEHVRLAIPRQDIAVLNGSPPVSDRTAFR